jgi:hypothetical protein
MLAQLISMFLQWFPKRATLWHEESLPLTGHELEVTIVSGHQYGFDVYQHNAGQGDSFSQSFLLRPGTYMFNVLGRIDTNRGKIDWYIDDVLVISGQDWYAGSLTYNIVKKALVTVKGPTPFHTLRGVVSDKNAVSLDYAMTLTKMWFTPAGEG